jgi:ribosomal protein S12 methylthiotransferase accessory factor
MSLEVRRRSRPHLADVAADLVDPLVGIVGYAGASPRQAGTPAWFHYWAQAADTASFVPQPNFARTGGAAADADRALAKALGEAVERYCAAIYVKDQLPLCTAADAPFDTIDPATFALNSDAQYREPGFHFVPFDRETPVRWASVRDALSGEERHVPAAMVFVPYYFAPGRSEPPIAQPISTGLACHESYAEAAAVALCEVVERDAFMITWQAQVAPPRIRLDSVPLEIEMLLARFLRARFDVTLFDITLDNGVPTVLAVSRHASPECPAVVVAASSNVSPLRAARSALEELAHTGHYCQEIVRGLPRLAGGAEAAVDQQSHLNYWCDHRRADAIEFLFASPRTIAFDEILDTASHEPHEDLDRLCRAITSTGHRPLLRELTTEDVAALGLVVVRAVVPGYQPLVSGHRYRALGGTRLRQVPQRLGHPGIDTEHDANPLPHPYP